jgi:hypothetical protein
MLVPYCGNTMQRQCKADKQHAFAHPHLFDSARIMSLAHFSGLHMPLINPVLQYPSNDQALPPSPLMKASKRSVALPKPSALCATSPFSEDAFP